MHSRAIPPAWETIDGTIPPARSRVRPSRAHLRHVALATAMGGGLCSGLLALARGEPVALALLQASVAFLFAMLALIPCARVLGTLLRAGHGE